MKKIISLLLATLMICGVLAACSDSGNSGDTAASDTLPAETENINPHYQNDGLPTANYNGATFTFLTATEITGGEMTVMDTDNMTDPLISTIHYRTQYVEERYGIDITDYRCSYAEAPNKIATSIAAQDHAFDACYGFIYSMFGLALEGYFTEFTDIPSIDLSQPWWDQSAAEAFTMNNRLFYMVGDANMFYNDYTWVLYFNKEVLTDIGEEEPYDLVESGDWTLDEMFRLGTKAVLNLDSDTEINKNTDRVGMVTHQYTANAMVYGCDELFFEKNSDDIPEITFETDRFINVCDKVTSIFHDGNFMYDVTGLNNDGSSIEETFASGRALFAGEVLQCARRYRGMETDFGILPYPKLDPTQNDYVTYSLEMVYPLAVPTYLSTEELDRAGIIIEALQSASHNTVMSAYFDAALTSKRFLRDERSEDMMKIIFNTRCYPVATMYDFGGTVGQVMNYIRNGNTGFASFIGSNRGKTEGDIEKVLDKLGGI